MEFSIIINKQANFYFFVQNLSEWHFSNRKSYNIFWGEELGEFSVKEKDALGRFKEIHLKYPFGESYLGRHFFEKEMPWETLDRNLSKKDFNEIRNTFNLLEGKFEKLYKKEYFLLEKWKGILNKDLNRQKDEINYILSKVYGAELLKNDINVYLLFSTKDQSGGGANINKESVSVEVSECPFDQENRIRGIIWHELVHLHFEKGYFLDLLDKKFASDQEKIGYIKEIIDCLLFPKGVLGKSILGIKSGSLNSRISIKNSDILLELTEKYTREQKKFDEEYIEKIANFV